MNPNQIIRRILFFVFLLGSAFPLLAFKFFPISMDFTPNGTGTVAGFEAVNDTTETIALKVTVFSRTMDTAGADVLAEVPEAFQVYPARMVLKPGQQQRVRVQYKGPDRIDAEGAYRIVVEQVPVAFSPQDKTGGVKILFRYIGSLYVVPPKSGFKVVVTGLEQIQRSGARFLRITLENNGVSHVILNNLTLRLKSGEGELDLVPAALTDLNGSNLLAGAKRICDIPWPEGLGQTDLSGEAIFDPAR